MDQPKGKWVEPEPARDFNKRVIILKLEFRSISIFSPPQATSLHQQQPIQSQDTNCMANDDKCKGQMILKSLNSKIMEVLRKLNTESTNDTLIRKLKEVHNEITNLDSKLGKILM